MRDTAVLIPAAGKGERLKANCPKALYELAGVPLLAHALRRVAATSCAARVVVAAPLAWLSESQALVSALGGELAELEISVVAGGADRRASVFAALKGLPSSTSTPIVLVHDAARAFAPPELFEAVAAAVRTGYSAVVPTLPVVDTIRRVDASGTLMGTVDRSSLRVVQTPQGFSFSTLWAAHEHVGAEAIATDDAALVEQLGDKIHAIDGSDAAFKITYEQDLVLARAMAVMEK